MQCLKLSGGARWTQLRHASSCTAIEKVFLLEDKYVLTLILSGCSMFLSTFKASVNGVKVLLTVMKLWLCTVSSSCTILVILQILYQLKILILQLWKWLFSALPILTDGDNKQCHWKVAVQHSCTRQLFTQTVLQPAVYQSQQRCTAGAQDKHNKT